MREIEIMRKIEIIIEIEIMRYISTCKEQGPQKGTKLSIRVRPWYTGCTGGNSLGWKSGPESNLRPPQIVPKSVCLSTPPQI